MVTRLALDEESPGSIPGPAAKFMNRIKVFADGYLVFGDKTYRCAIGRGGLVENKKEGDGATPMGCFPIRRLLYRADKISKPESVFETSPITKNDGWSDDVTDPDYNTQVKLPYAYSHEKLWREDNIYNIVVILGYNDDPPIAGKGSAIFMHIARSNYSRTAGCIALSEEDLRDILATVSKNTYVCCPPSAKV